MANPDPKLLALYRDTMERIERLEAQMAAKHPVPVKWEVQTYSLCDGWKNTFTVDDQPEVFATREEAQAALDEFLAEVAEAVSRGDMESGYSTQEFRIRPVEVSRG